MTNATETREFHIGDILSVTTDRLVSPRHIDGPSDLLGWMTGEPVWTHQLPRFARECRPSLLRQFPELAAIEVPDTLHSEEAVLAWLDKVALQYGKTRMVAPVAGEDHTSIDPVSELKMMRPDAQIVGVQVDDQ